MQLRCNFYKGYRHLIFSDSHDATKNIFNKEFQETRLRIQLARQQTHRLNFAETNDTVLFVQLFLLSFLLHPG